MDKISVSGSSLVFFNVSPYRLCIALELCSGDLESEIRHWAGVDAQAGYSCHKRPDWPQLLRIFREIVEGVDALHAKNIIHCDLKPANVFISADHKHIKIGDLGLSKVLTTLTFTTIPMIVVSKVHLQP